MPQCFSHSGSCPRTPIMNDGSVGWKGCYKAVFSHALNELRARTSIKRIDYTGYLSLCLMISINSRIPRARCAASATARGLSAHANPATDSICWNWSRGLLYGCWRDGRTPSIAANLAIVRVSGRIRFRCLRHLELLAWFARLASSIKRSVQSFNAGERAVYTLTRRHFHSEQPDLRNNCWRSAKAFHRNWTRHAWKRTGDKIRCQLKQDRASFDVQRSLLYVGNYSRRQQVSSIMDVWPTWAVISSVHRQHYY